MITTDTDYIILKLFNLYDMYACTTCIHIAGEAVNAVNFLTVSQLLSMWHPLNISVIKELLVECVRNE